MGISEDQIRNLVEAKPSVPWESRSPLSPEQSEMLVINMMEQAASDPNFEAKFRLLEKSEAAFSIGPKEEAGVSTKNNHYYNVKINERDFGADGYSAMDTALEGIRDWKMHDANAAAKIINGPVTEIETTVHAERVYLDCAGFLQQADKAGIADSKPPALTEMLYSYKLDDSGKVVESVPGEEPFSAFTKGMESPEGQGPAQQQQQLQNKLAP